MIGSNTSSTLVASAAQRKIQRGTVAGTVGEGWQAHLWDIYEQLGPVHYGINFKRHSAEKIDYFIAEVDEDKPARSKDPKANEALERLGDITAIVSELVAQQNVAGEGYLVGQERDDKETWEVWSTLEVRESQQARKKAPESVEPLKEEDFLLRIWRPSPKRHSEPDSPLRSVEQQCNQLLLLNENIGAVAMSRLSAGVLLVPSELSFPKPADEDPDTGANASGDPFMDEIIQIAVEPITDGESAARVAPAVVRGPKDYLDAIRQLTFGREIDQTFADMREELLRQIAAGLDLPPEIILGKADLNHWSAWDVDESAAKLHVDPDVLHILDGLTRGYLWPTLEEMGVTDPTNLIIWRDYSDLTSRPMSIDQAHNLAKDNIITGTEVRAVANLAPEKEPDLAPADIASRAEAVSVYYRAGFEPEAILSVLGLPAIEHTGVAPVTVQSEADVDNVEPSPAGPENVDRGPPDPPLVAGAGKKKIELTPLSDLDTSLAARIIEAAEAAFTRAIERAGAKVRTKAKKDRDLSAAIQSVPNDKVTLTLGPRRIEQLQLTADQLIPSNTFNPLADRLATMIDVGQDERRATLTQLTNEEVEPSPDEEDNRDAAIAFFIAALMVSATDRLFNASPAPDPAEGGRISDTITTGQQVYQLLTQAGGGGHVEKFTPETARGLGLGEDTITTLSDAGYIADTLTWVYGFPSNSFEPHRALGGKEFESREHPSLRSRTAWLGTTFYFPGDHKGCLCQMVPTMTLPDEPIADTTDLDQRNRDRLDAQDANPRAGIDDNMEIRSEATDAYQAAVDREKEITAVLEDVRRQTAGEFQHFGERVKYEPSIRDKIYREMQSDPSLTVRQAAAQVTDTNRYTLMWGADDAYRGSQALAVDSMNVAGWETVAQKNAWAKGDTFDGMVYKFRKAGAEVEIQFHTPQSAIIKDQSHTLYTKGRSLPNGPEKTALSAQIKALWNTDRGHVPPNMLDVGDPTAYNLDF